MARTKYRPFYALIQRIASSKPGVWVASRSLHQVDRFFFGVSGGRVTLSSLVAGVPLVLVTTTGAKSGLPRQVPLLCIRDQQNPQVFALIATNWGQQRYPAWYFNLRANPRASCTLAGKTDEYLAHEASGEEYARFWQYAVDTYVGYPLYKQRIQGRHIPIMVMQP